MASLMHKVSLGLYPREGPKWERLSDEARDLIAGLLCVDPEKRLGASGALTHPWFSDMMVE